MTSVSKWSETRVQNMGEALIEASQQIVCQMYQA